MTDLISRADAICEVLVNDGIDNIVDRINALPSAELVLQTPQTYGKSINPSNGEVVADYISRADAIEAVIAQRHKAELSDYNFALGLAEDAIRHLPSADAVQGEWIWRTDIPIGDGRTSAGYICSNCGEDYWHGNVFNYCPNCGAKMKGGAE